MSSNIRSMKRAAKRDKPKEGITTTLGKLVNSVSQNPQYSGPLDVLCSQAVPIGVSFRLSKIARAINSELEPYNATKKELCERFANKDEDGKAIILDRDGKRVSEGQQGNYDIPADKLPEFQKEHDALLAEEVSIPGEQVKVKDISGVTIAPMYLASLDWLISD